MKEYSATAVKELLLTSRVKKDRELVGIHEDCIHALSYGSSVRGFISREKDRLLKKHFLNRKGVERLTTLLEIDEKVQNINTILLEYSHLLTNLSSFLTKAAKEEVSNTQSES